MIQCWAGSAENRPTFSEIVTLLSQSLEGLTGYTSLLVENEVVKGDFLQVAIQDGYYYRSLQAVNHSGHLFQHSFHSLQDDL